MVIANIRQLDDPYKRALAYFALFQACIIKRPFNLFHRKNLYIRTSDVERNFGNKTTWDTPFPEHFLKFVSEANEAVFSNGRQNRALNCDIFDIEGDFDLVYVDTPYIASNGVGVDYLDFYHFPEGIVHYDAWGEMIDYRTKHCKLKHAKSIWADKERIRGAFARLFDRFRDSILVVSYRSDGIPSEQELVSTLEQRTGKGVRVARLDYKYVLSNNHAQEILLFIG